MISLLFKKCVTCIAKNHIRLLGIMKVNKYKSLTVTCFFLILFVNAKSFSYNRFEHLNVENGLAHTDAVAIVQDNSGLIWIGTNSGLQSYDGYSLQLYDYYKNSTSKVRKFHNRITALTNVGDHLWIGTKSGLLCFNLKQHNYRPYSINGSNLIADNEIKSVYADKKNLIWIKTANKIYCSRFDVENERLILLDSVNSIYPIKHGLDIFSIVSTEKYTWFITQRNIVQLQVVNNKIDIVRNYSASNLLPAGQSINSATTSKNFIYLRTEQGCVRIQTDGENGEIKLSTVRYINFNSVSPNVPVKSTGKLIVDNNDNLWVITQNGLLEINSAFIKPFGRFYTKIFSDPRSLSTNFLSTLFVDKNNNLWIGTWGGGVNYLSSHEPYFKLIKYTPDSKFTLQDQFVKAIETDPDGTLWILTQKGGLNHYDKNKGLIHVYNFADLPITNRVFKDLVLTPDKRSLLIGTMEGLILFDIKSNKSSLLIGQNGGRLLNKNLHIYSLATDAFNNIWVGTWDSGLICLHNDNNNYKIVDWLTNSVNKKISSNLISFIYCDKEKNEVFVCTDNGLNRLVQDNTGRVKRILTYKADEKKNNTITNDFISVIDKQNDSIYWLGTLGGGLVKLHIEDYRSDYEAYSYLKVDGVPGENIEIVLVDKSGDIWFSGNGIAKLDAKTNSISYYDYRDGLQGNSFKIGAGHKDNNGNLYFGGIYGLNYFNPSEIVPSKLDYKIILTNLYVHSKLIEPEDTYEGHVLLNKSLNETEKLTLKYNENDFAISFSALNFWTTSQIKYRYRLVGFNDAWQYINGDQNKIYYSNLGYNKYRFEIQVSSNGGKDWGPNLKKLIIQVLPPWWLSIYAKLLYFVLLILIIVTLFRFYNREIEMKHRLELKELEEKNLEENHQLKLQFFMNISHEFKTPLTLILSSVERLNLLKDASDLPRYFFESISRNAHKMLSLINELMDFRKTDIRKDIMHLSYNNISNYIYQIKCEFDLWAVEKNIEFNIQMESMSFYFDKEKIAKIVSNLFSNAIKYSESGGHVFVSIKKGYIKDIACKYSDNHVESYAENNSECCLIFVQDSGIGISKESISKIFERFFQIESKTSMHLGSGIGLAVVRNMVLSHKGAIIVSSQRNIGTEFIVAIPINLQPETSDIQTDSNFDINQYIEDQHLEYSYVPFVDDIQVNPVEESEKPILLLVEDNLELLHVLKNYFSKDYAVITAENGRIGLELCKTHFPDLIVSDIMMPEMDGVQLCASIRENLNISYIPIILLTAKGDVEYQLEGYEAGADLYLPKPFSIKLLELNLIRLLKLKEKLQKESLTNDYGNGFNIRNEIIDQKEKEFITKLIDLINQNLDDTEYSVEKLCKELGVGRTKLYTKVKENTGQALGDIIRDIKLNKAALLLRTTDMNITEVIYDVGFGSNSHFSKAFKLRFGMTPSDYAKQKNIL